MTTIEKTVLEQAQEIIEKFAYDELKAFMQDHIEGFATKKSLAFAKLIMAALRDHKKLLSDAGFSTHNDIVISAAFIAACYPVNIEKDWSDIFNPRIVWQNELIRYGVRKDIASSLFDLIESRFGEDTPVPRLKPQPNHPTEFFATAYYYFNVMHDGEV